MRITKEQLEVMKSSSEIRNALLDLEKDSTNLHQIIDKRSDEARSEEITVEKREAIINMIEDEKKELDELKDTMKYANAKLATIKSTEERQFKMIDQVKDDVVELRNEIIDKTVYSTVEYRDAYINYLKTKDIKHIERLVTTGTEQNGAGVVIPTMIANEIETLMSQAGRISVLCSKLTVKGDVSVPYEISATGAVFHEEGKEAPAEEEIELGEVTIKPKMIKKWIRVTDEMEAMDNGAFATYLATEIAEKIGIALDNAIISRTAAASKGVVGITTETNVLFKNDLVVTNIDFTTGYKALALLDDGVETGAVVVMNRLTFYNNIITQKATDGKPIYTTFTDENGKEKHYYAGMPVRFNSGIKAFDVAEVNDVIMIVGDFKGFTLNYPKGQMITMVRDIYSQAEEDIVKYVGKLFVGGRITKLKHFTTVKKGA